MRETGWSERSLRVSLSVRAVTVEGTPAFCSSVPVKPSQHACIDRTWSDSREVLMHRRLTACIHKF